MFQWFALLFQPYYVHHSILFSLRHHIDKYDVESHSNFRNLRKGSIWMTHSGAGSTEARTLQSVIKYFTCNLVCPFKNEIKWRTIAETWEHIERHFKNSRMTIKYYKDIDYRLIQKEVWWWIYQPFVSPADNTLKWTSYLLTAPSRLYDSPC